MNFLLHAYLAERELGEGGPALGAMLPDLWRMAARSARARRGVRGPERGAGPLAAVLGGVDHHLEVDTWFHRTEFFREGEQRTAEAFARVPAEGAPKLRLFAHVTWEMLLDGALVRRLGHERAAAMVARAFAQSRAAASEAADLHHGTRREAAGVDRATFEARMTRLFDAVETFALPGGYADAGGVVARLAGIRAAFGLPPPDETARGTWRAAVAGVEPFADDTLGALLAHRDGT